MIYNTTIISGSGERWQDASGNILTAIGSQNVYVGKNVWTDGKIIYGYDLPGYVARKVIKKVKKLYHEFIYYVTTTGVWGYNVETDSDHVVNNKSRAGDVLIASGSKLYNATAMQNTGDPDNPYKFVFTDILGNMTVDVPAWYNSSFYYAFNGDMGRNGGFLASSNTNTHLRVQHDFIYFIYERIVNDRKELAVDKYELSYIYTAIQNLDARIGSGGDVSLYCLNIGDDGTGTGLIQVYYNYDYYLYKLTFTPGNINIAIVNTPTVIVPAGDGMATFGFDINYGISTLGTVDVGNVNIPMYIYSKVTKTADAIFVCTPNDRYIGSYYFEFKMYDLQGNFVKDLVNSFLFIYANNFRLDLCDIESQVTAWGYT